MRLKKHFHWLVPQTAATQVAGQMLHCEMLNIFVTTVAESRTQFYFPQRFLQLISQRFWPLQGMLHWAMIRATCLAMALRLKQRCNSALNFCNISCCTLAYISLFSEFSLEHECETRRPRSEKEETHVAVASEGPRKS